jgi:hypothetical protein
MPIRQSKLHVSSTLIAFSPIKPPIFLHPQIQFSSRGTRIEVDGDWNHETYRYHLMIPSDLLLGFDNLIQSPLLHHYEQPWHLGHLESRIMSVYQLTSSTVKTQTDHVWRRYSMVGLGQGKQEGRTTWYSSKKVELLGNKMVRSGVGSLYNWEKKRLHCGKGVWEPVH